MNCHAVQEPLSRNKHVRENQIEWKGFCASGLQNISLFKKKKKNSKLNVQQIFEIFMYTNEARGAEQKIKVVAQQSNPSLNSALSSFVSIDT